MIDQALSIISPAFAEKAREKKTQAIDRAKREAVNVTEFDGQLCLAFDGIPLFPIEAVGIPYERLQQVLAAGRETWVKYQQERGRSW